MNDYKQLYTKSTKKSGGEPIIINVRDGFGISNDMLLPSKLYDAIQDGTIYNVWIEESSNNLESAQSPMRSKSGNCTSYKVTSFTKKFPYIISCNGQPVIFEQTKSVYEGLDSICKTLLQDPDFSLEFFMVPEIRNDENTNQLIDMDNNLYFTINGKSAIGQWDNGVLTGITTSDETFTYDNEPHIIDISQETANKLIGYINWSEFSGSHPNPNK